MKIKKILSLITFVISINCFAFAVFPQPPTRPIIDYRFDDPADFANGIVRNYASPNYFGTLYGSRTYALGVSGLSWESNNIDSYVLVPNSESIDTATNGFTAEAVIMRYSNDGEDGFIEKGGFLLTIVGSGNDSILKTELFFPDGTVGYFQYVFPDLSYLNNWMRVTLTVSKNKSGTIAKFYINGQQVAEQFFAGKFLQPSNFPMAVGAIRDWARFNGRIDEVKLWTKELTKGQIASRQN
jgi:hypothetical protein